MVSAGHVAGVGDAEEPGPHHAEPCRSCEEFGFYCRCDKKPSQWLLSKEEEGLVVLRERAVASMWVMGGA